MSSVMVDSIYSDKGLEGDNLPRWLSDFVSTYQLLNTDNLELLNTVYHSDVVFTDPMHKVNGINNLQAYFHNLYENLISCKFVVEDVFFQDESAAVYWTMTYRHKQLNAGQAVSVEGHSLIKAGVSSQGEKKVIYHRDYVDLGAMLYEQLPVIGRFIAWLKKRAAK